jgi:tRNA nucleotidyltransferase (CCA-adding enzyme)
MAQKELLPLLWGRLTEAERKTANTLVEIAAGRSERAYLVGGSVRDLLLGRPHVDLDIAIEGDAIAVARELAGSEGRVVAHQAFGTASVELSGSHVDLAQTRAETYERPGALPTVRPASIQDDLQRRDFAVNAMALRLTAPSAGELLDPHEGEGDLRLGLLRALHEKSFQDDATRLLRGVRYEARLGFRLEKETERLLRRDLEYLNTISGARLRAELLAMFFEGETRQMLRRCQEMGILSAIHPCLAFDEEADAALERAREERPTPWDEVCLCTLAWHADEPDIESLAGRLALPRRYERALADSVKLLQLVPDLSDANLKPSQAVEMLDALTAASIWALALRDEGRAADRARLYLNEWRYVKSFLGASALRRLGVPAGPELGALLRRLRAARLDGLTHNRDEEMELAGQYPKAPSTPDDVT